MQTALWTGSLSPVRLKPFARPKPTYDPYLKLILAQMVLDDLGTPTISFFMHAWPYLQGERGISCTDLAKKVCISSQCARKHIQKLESLNYAFRVNYRAWRLAENPLKDKDLNEMKRLAVSHHIIQPDWERRPRCH